MAHSVIRRVDGSLRAVFWLLVTGLAWQAWDVLRGRELHSPRSLTDGTAQHDVPPQARASGPTLEQLAGIWSRDLHQTLVPPPPEPVIKPKPPPPTPVSLPALLATFVEHKHKWGVFLDERGTRRVRRTGSTIAGFHIVGISPGAAQLKKGSQTYDVRVPQPSIGKRNARRRG